MKIENLDEESLPVFWCAVWGRGIPIMIPHNCTKARYLCILYGIINTDKKTD